MYIFELMLEIGIAALSAVITALTLLIGINRIINSKVDQLIYEGKEEFFQWLQSENGAKVLYGVGALIGNGAKSGFGITTRGGKFKLEDLIAQIAGGFIQQKFGVPTGQPQPEVEVPQVQQPAKSVKNWKY